MKSQDRELASKRLTGDDGGEKHQERDEKDIRARPQEGQQGLTTGDDAERREGKATVPKPTVTIQPNWPVVYRGEKVTLRCEIQGGGGTQWTYEWRPTSKDSPTFSEYRINAAESRNYMCRGRRDRFTLTNWGVLTVSSSKPQPVLSVSPSWLSPGASVTLSCGGLEHPSAGWSLFWYKAVPEKSSKSYRFELLANSTNGTEQNSYIIHGPTHTAGYVCRAGRGEPLFYTDYSEPKFFWSAESHPKASLSVSLDRVQHFLSQSLTLNCSGNNTKWRVNSFTETVKPSNIQCSDWRTMSGSSCTINNIRSHSGVYWCEFESGDFSNAVNITVLNDHNNGIILVSPVHPVTEGDPVTLTCRYKEKKLLSNVFFYHDDKLLHNDSRGELNISAVLKSDEGFYKCKHSGKESPQSWMSVRVSVSSPVISSLPVLWIAGTAGGILLVMPLSLCCYIWSKDAWCIRSESSSQSSTTNHGVNTTNSQVYSSLLHGDTSEYESIQPATNNRFMISKEISKPEDPEEDPYYTFIETETAGSRSPAATD